MMPKHIDKCSGCLHEKEDVSCDSCKECKIVLATHRMTRYEHDPKVCGDCANYRRTPICRKCIEYSEFAEKDETEHNGIIDERADKLAAENKRRKFIVRRLDEVLTEIIRANEIHGINFNSSNEAAGVVREEYLELEHELFHGDPERAREEAVQLAAVAVKTICYLDGKAGRR